MVDCASAEPAEDNDFRAEHVQLLRASLQRWTGRDLPAVAGLDATTAARRVFAAPYALLSHGTGVDPSFTYANRCALALFELRWADLICLPSRLSAEAVEQDQRARLLAEVSRRGVIENYGGVRVSRTGQRFRIERATVWNLVDDSGHYRGQAAMFAHWQPVGRGE